MQRIHNRVPPYAKNDKICLLQLVTWDMMFSSTVILKVSSTLISSKGSSSNKEEKLLGSVYIPYVKGVSEKFKCIGNQYNTRMIFRNKHTLRS
jgi:hypothetical protein